MSSLGKELHETIQNLEKIRDSQNPPDTEVIVQLDTLYEQQMQLIDAAINATSLEYKNTTQSLREAAKKTREAIDDLSKLADAIKQVADGIDKVYELLDSVT